MNKKLEPALLTALALTWVLGGVLTASLKVPPLKEGRTFQSEEAQVKERLKRTLEVDPNQMKKRILGSPSLRARFTLASLGLSLLLAGTIFVWVRGAFRLLRGRPLFAPLGSPPAPTWRFREIFRLILILLLIAQWAFLIERFLWTAFQPAWLDVRAISLGNTLIIDLAVIVGCAPFFPVGAGLLRPGSGSKIRFALRSYLLFLPCLVFILLLVTQAAERLGHPPAPQPVFTLYLAESRTAALGWLLFLAAVVGPVAEEIFFRGLLYGWLRSRIGVWKGIGLTALLFAGLHTDAVLFLPLFGLGLLFGWVYEKTGSLAAPMALHILHNGGMLYLASLVKSMIS